MTRQREYALRSKFGITLQQYDELLARQNGGCAICQKTPEEEGRALAVEHNHRTGEIFGLACSYCNRYVIGRHLPVETVEKLLTYLKGGTGWFVPAKKKRRRKAASKRKPRGR